MTTPGGLVLTTDLITVNHRANDTLSDGQVRSWPGWFIAAPARHVTRSFHLTAAEAAAMTQAVARIDAVLAEVWGVTRCMIASLGERVGDHLHVHVVPTVTDPTRGWRNLHRPADGPAGPPEMIARQVAQALARTNDARS